MQSKKPLRTCAVLGTEHPQQDLLRFVAAPDGTPTLDLTGKLPGRGLYLTPTAAVYAQALKRKTFAHQLETTQPAPAWAVVQTTLAERALHQLGLARKAGQAVPGADAVREVGNHIKAIILAADAGADTVDKMNKMANYRDVPLCRAFTKAQLEAALGAPHTSVVGLTRLDTAWPSVHKAEQALVKETA